MLTKYKNVTPQCINVLLTEEPLSLSVTKIMRHSTAVIWRNPLSPLLHFSRKSSFSFQVFLGMFLIVDFFNFWFDKSA